VVGMLSIAKNYGKQITDLDLKICFEES